MKKEVLNEKSIVATTEQIARNNTYIHPLAPFVAKMFEAAIDKNERDVVIVCFGTNAISGDSLGPLVGTLLTKNITSAHLCTAPTRRKSTAKI